MATRETTEIVTTYSPRLREIVEVTNHVSHNLFADALIKTIGLDIRPVRERLYLLLTGVSKYFGTIGKGKDSTSRASGCTMVAVLRLPTSYQQLLWLIY